MMMINNAGFFLSVVNNDRVGRPKEYTRKKYVNIEKNRRYEKDFILLNITVTAKKYTMIILTSKW